MSTRLSPTTLLFLMMPPLCWAGNVVLGRAMVGHIPPLALSFWRWLIAFALILPFTFRGIVAAQSEIRARWPDILIMGTLGIGTYNSFQYVALQTSSALNVTLIVASGPVFSLLVGALIASGRRAAVVFTGLGVVGAVAGSLAFFPQLSIPLRFLVVGLWFVISGGSIAALMATLPAVAEAHRRGAAAALMNQAAATATFVNPPIWLPLSAAGAWTPFAALMTGGWVVAVASVWGIAVSRRRGGGA